MKKLETSPESAILTGKPTQFTGEYWFDDACILDMDYFVKTLAGIKAKGVRPDLIGSIIAHYASKWLPDLAGDNDTDTGVKPVKHSPESVTSSWMKKRFFVETLVGILPPEIDSIPCNFLLRLLRTGNMVGIETSYRIELENRISWQLDQASLKELMMPSFSHTCATLLDVELVLRLVTRFVSLDEAANKNGVALVKVAKLVDAYLAEAALDLNLTMQEFAKFAAALPCHARASDDGLYRAIDTYLKAHPGVSKQERKSLCSLIESRKLSAEASLHAAQNERLPVRAVIQVIFSEQTKLNRSVDWSGSFSGTRSPKPGLEPPPSRCPSKRQVTAQQVELRKLREDVARLQNQCNSMQAQIEKLKEKKKVFFRWVSFFIPSSKSVSVAENIIADRDGETEHVKSKLVKCRATPKRRFSTS